MSRYIPVRFTFDAMAGRLALQVDVPSSPSQHIAPVAFERHSPLTVAGEGGGHGLGPLWARLTVSLFIQPSYWSGKIISLDTELFGVCCNVAFAVEPGV